MTLLETPLGKGDAKLPDGRLLGGADGPTLGEPACCACTAANDDFDRSSGRHPPAPALAEAGLRASAGFFVGVEVKVGSGGRPVVGGVLLEKGLAVGLSGVFVAAASAMTLRKSTFSASTALDFHTAPLPEPPTDKSNGVIGLDPALPDIGVGMSSSIANISSPVGTFIARVSGVKVGETVLREALTGVIIGSDGDNAGDRGFHRHGCRIRGAGMSCTASHSLCFSIAALTSSPDRDTDSLRRCCEMICCERSSKTSSCISSSSPDSSIVSMHAMI